MYHCIGGQSEQWQDQAAEEYGAASLIVDGYEAYAEEHGTAPTGSFPYVQQDEETLEVITLEATLKDYQQAVQTLASYGEEPDPANYGIWVPGIPVLVGNALEAAGAADWLAGLYTWHCTLSTRGEECVDFLLQVSVF